MHACQADVRILMVQSMTRDVMMQEAQGSGEQDMPDDAGAKIFA